MSGDRQRAVLGALVVVTPAQVNLSGGQPLLGGLPGEERLALQLAPYAYVRRRVRPEAQHHGLYSEVALY